MVLVWLEGEIVKGNLLTITSLILYRQRMSMEQWWNDADREKLKY
jgi:hypothetical protein